MRPRFHKGSGSGGQRPTELHSTGGSMMFQPWPVGRWWRKEQEDLALHPKGLDSVVAILKSSPRQQKTGLCTQSRGLLGGRAGPPGGKEGGKEESHLGQPYLFLTATLKGKVDYDLCFMVEEPGSERLGNLSRGTQQGHGKTEAPIFRKEYTLGWKHKND